MEWAELSFDSGFDPETKFKELVETITEALGQGATISKTNRNTKYAEWHSGACTIQLYGSVFDVRFLMF